MSRQALIDEIASAGGKTKVDADREISAFIDGVKAVVAKGGKVQLRGFGNFEMKLVPERQARNPRTGEPITIAEHRALKFKASKA